MKNTMENNFFDLNFACAIWETPWKSSACLFFPYYQTWTHKVVLFKEALQQKHDYDDDDEDNDNGDIADDYDGNEMNGDDGDDDNYDEYNQNDDVDHLKK